MVVGRLPLPGLHASGYPRLVDFLEPLPARPIDLVVIDLAWTPQRLAIPAALRWLAPGGRILTLLKPHYELLEEEKSLLEKGFLPHEHAHRVQQRVLETLPEFGTVVLGSTMSPLVGSKTARRRGVPGNLEFLALLEPISEPKKNES